MRKARRCPSNHENKRPAAKAGRSVFPQILVGLLPIRNCIWDWSKHIISSVATFHEVSFRHLAHRNRTEFDQTLRAEYVYVQYIARCENVDDLSVENWICNTLVQKENNSMVSQFKFLILLCRPLRIIT